MDAQVATLRADVDRQQKYLEENLTAQVASLQALINDILARTDSVEKVQQQQAVNLDGAIAADDRKVKSRLDAVETAFCAPVQISRNSGKNCRFAHSVLDRDQVALRSVSLHKFDIDAPFETLSAFSMAIAIMCPGCP